jgi:hypothetical protein
MVNLTEQQWNMPEALARPQAEQPAGHVVRDLQRPRLPPR